MFFVRESLRSIKRNAIPSFAAMASVLVTLLVLGVFIPVVQATTGAANEVRSKVLLDVYMKTDAKLDKKVIVVVTDGNDNASGDNPTLEQLLRKVRDSGTLVYSLGLLSEEEAREARAAKRALNSLAETTIQKIPPDVAPA